MTDYELLLELFYSGILRPGDTAVDAGSHVGRHAFIMAKHVAPSGRVYCFEPLTECRKSMRGDSRWPHLASILRLSPSALGSRNGDANFVVAVDLPAYSGFKERVYDGPTRTETITVPVQRLDDVLGPDSDPVRYIKVDTEGAELEVFQGGRSLLERDRPIVSFEFGMNSAAPYGVEPESVYEFWAELGYRVFDIVTRETDQQSFAESAWRQQVWDYLALPEELACETMDSYRLVLEGLLGERPWE